MHTTKTKKIYTNTNRLTHDRVPELKYLRNQEYDIVAFIQLLQLDMSKQIRDKNGM